MGTWRRLSCVVVSAFVAVVLCGSIARAQKATKAAELPPPEKAVVFELNMPWRAAQTIVKGTRAQVYGLERGDVPTFRVMDAGTNFAWLYRPRLQINVDQYPIVHFKYRAKNLAGEFPNLLRLAFSQSGTATFLLFGSDKIQADGEVHEVTQDLRELSAAGALHSVAFFVFAGDACDGSLEVFDLSFHAPEESPQETFEDGPTYAVTVKDADGNPISGASVSVDYERRNFARNATTDDNGTATIQAGGNELSQHMLRIAHDGFVTSLVASGNPPETMEVGLIPASYYGGVATDGGGNAMANARVDLSIDPRSPLASSLGYPLSETVVTDAEGKWTTSIAFPADDAQVRIVVFDAGGQQTPIEAANSKVEPPKAKSQKTVASASTKATTAKVATKPALPDLLTKIDGTTIVGVLSAIDGKTLQIKPQEGDAVDVVIADVFEVAFRATSQPSAATKPSAAAQPNNTGDGGVVGAVVRRLAGNAPRSSGPQPTSANAQTSAKNAPKKPAPPSGSWQFTLAGGDTLYAKVGKWADRKIAVKSVSVVDAIELPVDGVREIWIATAAKIAKAKALGVITDAQDVAYVAKDNDVVSVTGIVDGIEGESLLFTFNDQQRKIALNRLVGITLGGQNVDPEAAKAREFDFRQSLALTSGEMLSGTLKSLEKGVIAIDVEGIASPLRVPKDRIDRILVRNGRLVFLSDLTPAKVEQTPYFERTLPYRIDKSLANTPIVIQDGPTTRGVSMPSRCVLTYDVGGKFDEFKARLGFQQPEGRLGRANVRVLGDGKVLFETGDARGDQPPVDVDVKMSGVKQLTLEVDFGQQQDVGDWIVFAEPRLLRENLE